MKRQHWWPVVLLALLAVLFMGVSSAVAQEKPAAKEKDSQTPKVNTEKKAGTQKKSSDEEEKPTLEKRLKALQEALSKYVSRSIFGPIPRRIDSLARLLKEGKKGLINPETGKQIVMNPQMAGTHSVTIKKPEEFITFYADKDTPNKGRAVVFGDGKVKYLDKKTFLKMLRASVGRRMSPEERGMYMDAIESRGKEERQQHADQ